MSGDIPKTRADHAPANAIAKLMERLIKSNIARTELMILIDQEFFIATLKLFLCEPTLFEVRRQRGLQ